jgi:hypothetical protein
LEWWIADVEVVSSLSPDDLGSTEAPDRCGQTPSFLGWANQVGENQFMWGVFVAARPGAPVSSMRPSPSARDGRWCDIGDAIAEVRAIDTSYIEVLFADPTVADALRAHFNAQALPPG